MPNTASGQPTPTALIAEDEPLLAAALRAELAQAWPELRVLATVGDGLNAVREARCNGRKTGDPGSPRARSQA